MTLRLSNDLTYPAASGVCLLKRRSSIGSCKTHSKQSCSLQQVGQVPREQHNYGPDNLSSEAANNPAHHRYEFAVDGHIAATYCKIADDLITSIQTALTP